MGFRWLLAAVAGTVPVGLWGGIGTLVGCPREVTEYLGI